MGRNRADVFDKYGIEVPKYWPDAVEAAKELTGGKQYGFTCSLRRGIYTTMGYTPILYSCGGEIFDKYEKGFYNPTLYSDAGIKAAEILKNLVKHAAPGTLNAVDDETNEHLIRGTGVYGPMQWGASVFTDPKYCKFHKDFRATVVPTMPGHVPVPTMGGLGFIIPKNAKHKKEVWKWIKFCNSKKIEEKWVKNTGQPSRLSTLKKYTHIQPYFTALMESIPIARRMTPVPEFASIYTTIGTELASAMVGDKPIEAALKAADKAVDRIMIKGGHRG